METYAKKLGSKFDIKQKLLGRTMPKTDIKGVGEVTGSNHTHSNLSELNQIDSVGNIDIVNTSIVFTQINGEEVIVDLPISSSIWNSSTNVLTITHEDGSQTIANIPTAQVLDQGTPPSYNDIDNTITFTWQGGATSIVDISDLFDDSAFYNLTKNDTTKTITAERLSGSTVVVDLSSWFHILTKAEISNDSSTIEGLITGQRFKQAFDTHYAGGLTIPLLDEDDLGSNSNTHAPTQQSVRAYVDVVTDAFQFENNLITEVRETGFTTNVQYPSEQAVREAIEEVRPVSYSTIEQDTGLTWINGSPIYQKTVEIPNVSTNNNNSVVHGVNLKQAIGVEGMQIQTNGNFLVIPSGDSDGAYDNRIVITDTHLIFYSGSATIGSAYFTIKYLKE